MQNKQKKSMNIFFWILQVGLALFFLMPAITKMITCKQKLIEKGQLAPNGSVVPVRLIGIMELLGCIGIVFPLWLNIFPILTPIAAVGFCIVMAGAFAVHYIKKEYKLLPLVSLVFIASAIVAFYRF